MLRTQRLLRVRLHRLLCRQQCLRRLRRLLSCQLLLLLQRSPRRCRRRACLRPVFAAPARASSLLLRVLELQLQAGAAPAPGAQTTCAQLPWLRARLRVSPLLRLLGLGLQPGPLLLLLVRPLARLLLMRLAQAACRRHACLCCLHRHLHGGSDMQPPHPHQQQVQLRAQKLLRMAPVALPVL